MATTAMIDDHQSQAEYNQLSSAQKDLRQQWNSILPTAHIQPKGPSLLQRFQARFLDVAPAQIRALEISRDFAETSRILFQSPQPPFRIYETTQLLEEMNTFGRKQLGDATSKAQQHSMGMCGIDASYEQNRITAANNALDIIEPALFEHHRHS